VHTSEEGKAWVAGTRMTMMLQRSSYKKGKGALTLVSGTLSTSLRGGVYSKFPSFNVHNTRAA